MAMVAVAAAVLPVVVAATRAIAHHWAPVGDDAFFSLRARDVLTGHHPLLGTWTSASQSIGVDVNNPGPLLFDWLAVPTKLAAYNGLIIGAALLNAACIGGIAVFAWRQGGAVLVAAAMAMCTALAWTMGSELLFDPWQPHSMLFPFLFLTFLVWSMANGDLAALPWAAGVASFIVETHLSYAVLAPVFAGAGVVALAASIRRGWKQEPDRRQHDWDRLRRVVLVTAVVLVLCWAQPFVEQFTEAGGGNLGRLATHASSSEHKVGAVNGARLIAAVVARPPFWARPSFGHSFAEVLPQESRAGEFRRLKGVPGSRAAAAGLLVVGAVVAGGTALAWRRRDRLGLTGLATGAVALGLGFLTAATLPIGNVGTPGHQLRWLWPISIFLTAAVILAALRRWRGAVYVFTAIAVLLGALAVPAHNSREGPNTDEWSSPLIHQLAAQLGPLDHAGTILFDVSTLRFAEPFSAAVILELEQRGVDVVVSDGGMIRQLGDARRDSGDAVARLYLRSGPTAFEVPPGEDRIALVRGLGPEERAELDSSADEVQAILERNGLHLNDHGERAVELGQLPTLAAQRAAGTVDIGALIEDREIQAIIQFGYLVLDRDDRAMFKRYATLQEHWDRGTVAAFLAPIDTAPSGS